MNQRQNNGDCPTGYYWSSNSRLVGKWTLIWLLIWLFLEICSNKDSFWWALVSWWMGTLGPASIRTRVGVSFGFIVLAKKTYYFWKRLGAVGLLVVVLILSFFFFYNYNCLWVATAFGLAFGQPFGGCFPQSTAFWWLQLPAAKMKWLVQAAPFTGWFTNVSNSSETVVSRALNECHSLKQLAFCIMTRLSRWRQRCNATRSSKQVAKFAQLAQNVPTRPTQMALSIAFAADQHFYGVISIRRDTRPESSWTSAKPLT